MNKEQVVSAISEKNDSTKKEAQEFLDAFIEVLTDKLSEGDEGDSIQLAPFGSFAIKIRKATTGRNPRTGEAIDIPEKKVVKFTPAKKLKDSVNA